MSKLSELNPKLAALADNTQKIITEIQALKDSLADVELPADAQASLDRLEGLIKTADELNPDAPTPEPPPAA